MTWKQFQSHTSVLCPYYSELKCLNCLIRVVER